MGSSPLPVHLPILLLRLPRLTHKVTYETDSAARGAHSAAHVAIAAHLSTHARGSIHWLYVAAAGPAHE